MPTEADHNAAANMPERIGRELPPQSAASRRYAPVLDLLER
jgi:hypothetical protein